MQQSDMQTIQIKVLGSSEISDVYTASVLVMQINRDKHEQMRVCAN